MRRLLGSPRRGFTLTELLVTVAIATVLLAVSLPLVKFSLEEGKIRESSRQVNAFLAKVKSWASANDRVAACWIERDPVNPNIATNLYLAEVPPPFNGAFADSRVKVNGSGSLDFVQGTMSAQDTNSLAMLDSMQRVGTSTPPPTIFGIRLDFKGPIYVGTASYSGSAWTYQLNSVSPLPPMASATGYPYQFYRPPQRVNNQHIELPKGTFIALDKSGLGAAGAQLAAGSATDASPVIIAFTSGGSFSGIYASGFSATPYVPDAPLHLLVARIRAQDTKLPLDDLTNLWVSIGSASGTILTSDNGSDGSGNLATAREFAIKHDIRGGR